MNNTEHGMAIITDIEQAELEPFTHQDITVIVSGNGVRRIKKIQFTRQKNEV